MKPIQIIIISFIVTALVVGGGTYYLINAKATKDKNNLQSQITDLNKKLADVQTTNVPVNTDTSITPATNSTNSTGTQSVAQTDPLADAKNKVILFEDDYMALGKDPSNQGLRHKLLYDYFVKPTNQNDIDFQKTLDGQGSGGPVLMGSASAGSKVLSYKIIKASGSANNPLLQIQEITINNAQGNTKKLIRTRNIQLIKKSDNAYLIQSYLPSQNQPSNPSIFDGFFSVE